MSDANRHQQLTRRLRAIPDLALPPGGVAVMYSVRNEQVEAGYLWIGEKRRPSHRTITRAGGDLNVDVDADGNFIGLEMLRKITDAEAQRFYRWAHRHWDAPRGKPHWPCSALLTLLRTWERAERLVCPGCRKAREDGQRSKSAPEEQWTPELATR